jgi:N-methylhydantoinase A/oxoprolinase/acetone carboxylase beta subunit
MPVVAEKAGIDRVAVPKLAAVFSAFGIGACDISQRYAVVLDDRSDKGVGDALAALKVKASGTCLPKASGRASTKWKPGWWASRTAARI